MRQQARQGKVYVQEMGEMVLAGATQRSGGGGGEGTGMGQGVEGEAKWEEEEGKNVVVGRRRGRRQESTCNVKERARAALAVLLPTCPPAQMPNTSGPEGRGRLNGCGMERHTKLSTW